MVPFAGYSMPIQYEGIIAEHRWTRESAGLFDVSHMGQLIIAGPDAEKGLETLLPADLSILKDGQASLFAAAQRRRRHHRRSDGDAARGPFLHGRERRHQAWRHRAYAREAARERGLDHMKEQACSRCRGRRRPKRWRGSRRASRSSAS
jgi:hypothetical protein